MQFAIFLLSPERL